MISRQKLSLVRNLSIIMSKHIILVYNATIVIFVNVVCAISSNNTEVNATELQRLIIRNNNTLEFSCKLKSDNVKACIIGTPYNKIYQLYYEHINASYESRRINMSISDPRECNIKIKNMSLKDNGVWKCTLSWTNMTSGFSHIAKKLFNVVVHETNGISINIPNVVVILFILFLSC